MLKIIKLNIENKFFIAKGWFNDVYINSNELYSIKVESEVKKVLKSMQPFLIVAHQLIELTEFH